MDTARLAGLSDGQKDCLRLVARHFGSKEIARLLDISPHTVDQRLKVAMRVLGVESRFEAARMLLSHEAGHQSLVYQRPDIAGFSACPAPIAPQPDAQQPGLSVREEQAPFRVSPHTQSVPVGLVAGEKRNELSAQQKMAYVLAVAFGSAIAFGSIVAGLEALSRLI